MLHKIKILWTTISETKVIEGSRFCFIFYFCLTHGINSIGKYLPDFATLLRKVCYFFIQYKPRWARVFIIKNNTGIFEVVPLNDSMTISADYFEKNLSNWLDKPAQKRTFIDIGAHIGRYTILASKHFHYKKVLAIEANPATFTTLKKNINLNNITSIATPVQIALSDKAGIVKFETNKSNLAVGHVVTEDSDNAGTSKNEIIQVAAEKASVVVSKNHINFEEIDFIKMDVEGFEDHVLEGMHEVLEKMPHGSYVMIEISNPENKKAQTILEQHHFKLLSIDRADYFFVKN